MVIRAVQAASTLTPDYEVIVVNDGSADDTARGRRRARPHLSRRSASCITRRTAATAARCRPASGRRPRTGLLHRRRRPVRPERAGAAVAEDDAADVDLVNGYKISRSDPFHRIIIGRLYHHFVRLLFGLTRARRRLRLPPDAAVDLRPRPPREDQRRHLPRDDEEDPRRRLPDRRSAGAPLPPRLRQVAVLQLPPGDRAPAVDVLRLWWTLVVRSDRIGRRRPRRRARADATDPGRLAAP